MPLEKILNHLGLESKAPNPSESWRQSPNYVSLNERQAHSGIPALRKPS